MAITLVSGTNAALGNVAIGDAVSIAVLKKAVDIEARNAAQLLQALPSPQANHPAHLGNHVNTFA